MLNVWHLVAYQRYYDGLVAATAPSAAPTGRKPAAAPAALNASGSNIVDVRGWGGTSPWGAWLGWLGPLSGSR